MVKQAEKKFENLIECSLKNKESKKKKKKGSAIPSSDEGDMTKTSSGALNSNLLQ